MKFNKNIGLVIFLALAMLIAVGCNNDAAVNPEGSPADAEVDAEGVALTKDKCVSCHSLEVAVKERAQKDWPQVVDRMLGYQAGLLNEVEKDQIIVYLQTYHSK